jgi:hypothetical protein
MNDMTFGDPDQPSNAWTVMIVGLFFFMATLFAWFRMAIKENLAGMNVRQFVLHCHSPSDSRQSPPLPRVHSPR